MNERPGRCITGDLAVYLAPESQGKGLGSYLLSEAIRHPNAARLEWRVRTQGKKQSIEPAGQGAYARKKAFTPDSAAVLISCAVMVVSP